MGIRRKISSPTLPGKKSFGAVTSTPAKKVAETGAA
jgi:hypothetical protein